MARRFAEILENVVQNFWKYVSKHLQFAKEARICDPRQIATSFVAIEDFPHVFPSDRCHAIVDGGEWRLFRENVVADSRDCHTLQWWEGMFARLPLMYKCVRRTLSVPHTSCDVERTFLVWKCVLRQAV